MRKLLTENLGIKISALLIALFLWFFVTSRGQSEISLEVPIEFKNIPAGLGIVSSSHKTAVVNIRGQERLMKNIKSAGIRVMVDLDKAKKGDGVFHINKEEIKLPYAMSVTTVSPPSVKIRMDETGTRKLRVRPVVVGEPEKGFAVRSIEVEPDSLTIDGLKSEIRRIHELRTVPFDITGLTETTVQDLDIESNGANVAMEKTSVRIRVVITGGKR